MPAFVIMLEGLIHRICTIREITLDRVTENESGGNIFISIIFTLYIQATNKAIKSSL